MSETYQLDWSNTAKTPITLAPGQKDERVSTSLRLYGENSFLWGEGMNENMMHLLENFSSDVEPDNPTVGQLWWKTSINQLMVYDGSAWLSVSESNYGKTTVQLRAPLESLFIAGDGFMVYDWNYAIDDPNSLYVSGSSGTFTDIDEIRAPATANFIRIKFNGLLQTGTNASPYQGANNPYARISTAVVNEDYTVGGTPLGNWGWWLTGNLDYPLAVNWTAAALNYFHNWTSPWIPIPSTKIEVSPGVVDTRLRVILGTGGLSGETIYMSTNDVLDGNGEYNDGTWMELSFA